MKTESLISASARVSKLFGIVVLAAFLTVSPAKAQEAQVAQAAHGKIAVVDKQYLIANSKAGKSIRDQLASKRDAYRKEIEKQEAALNKEGQALKDQQPKISKEEFLKRYKALDEKAKKGQQGVFERTKAFEKAYIQALSALDGHIGKIVADIAGKNNIALVLNRQEVVLVDAKMDLTKQVLGELDKKVSSIPVSLK